MPTMFRSGQSTRAGSGRTIRKSSTCKRIFLLVDNILKQVGLELGVAWRAGGGQVEHFLRRHFAEVLAQSIEEWRLRGVKPERLVLFLEAIATHLDVGCDGKWRDRHPVWQYEIGGAVVELWRAMRGQTFSELFRVAIGPPSPLKRLSGESPRHSVVGMPCQSSIRAKGQNHMGTNCAYPRDQVADHFEEIGTVELAVRVVQHLTMADSQEFARGCEFSGAKLCEFFVGARGASIFGGGSGSQADGGSFYPLLAIQQQRSAE